MIYGDIIFVRRTTIICITTDNTLTAVYIPVVITGINIIHITRVVNVIIVSPHHLGHLALHHKMSCTSQWLGTHPLSHSLLTLSENSLR